MEIQSLTLLANMLANQFGVDVVAEGSTACCSYNKNTGKTVISVPAFIADDNAQRVYVRGYIDHEVGHVRFTNHNLVSDADHTLHTIQNILEDVYVERMMGKCYPGCAANLAAMQRQLFEIDKTFEKSRPPVTVDRDQAYSIYWTAIRYILYKARNIGSLLPIARTELEQLTPGLIARLDPLLSRIPACKSTQDNVNLAQNIYAELMTYWNNPPMDNQQGQDQHGQDQQGQDQHGQDQQGQDQQGQDQQGQDQQGQDQQGQDEMRDACQVAASISCDRSANGFAAIIQDVLDRSVEQEISRATRERATQDKDLYAVTINSTKMDYDKNCRMLAALPDKHKAAAETCSAALAAQLQALMQAKGLRKRQPGRYGRLDNNRLHRLVMNDAHVFLRNTDVRQVNTQVIILCDASGSMQIRSKDIVTSQAVYALIKALRNIPGVKSAAYIFGGVIYAPMITFDTPLYRGKLFMEHCAGHTPGGTALQRVIQEFDFSKDDRKIVLMMTDGALDEGEAPIFQAVYNEAKDYGIDIIGIGILSDEVENLWNKGDFFHIEQLNELAPNMFKILKARLV